MTSFVKTAAATSVFFAALATGLGSSALAEEAQIIQLTQTPCQFVESENGTDHGYTSTQKADCVAINDKTGAERLAAATPITLKPGKYIFRVTNKNVPYDLGFYLRGASLISKATLPSTSGGGLSTGTTKDYEITLTEGEYVYSCPLNNTPDYKLTVTSG